MESDINWTMKFLGEIFLSELYKKYLMAPDGSRVGKITDFTVSRGEVFPLIDSFVIADGLHMNDWGYACFAQLLGDDIIKSVGQIKLGVNVPGNVQTYRPM